MNCAKDVMNKDVLMIRAGATVRDAINTLLKQNISGAPVVDTQGRLVGIISEFQLMEAVYTPAVKSRQVRDTMTKDVITVKEETLVSEIVNLFVLHRIRRIPVMRGDEIVGVVSRRDLLRHIIETDEVSDPLRQEVKAVVEQ